MASAGSSSILRIGVDVGETFTDLVAFDGMSLRVVKLPFTPPDFERAVNDAFARAAGGGAFAGGAAMGIVHGSTVATRTLLERKGERVAFITEMSGPAGGVTGALLAAHAAGLDNVITYDMGGASTKIAMIVGGKPQWTSEGVVGGHPTGLPALDIHTVDVGGGSIAYLDAFGALRVGPRSASAAPGPACYGRGGTAPTVTDANLLLGRILPDRFAGGAMRVDRASARGAVEALGPAIGTTVEEAAARIVHVAEENVSQAIRSVTSLRGQDPKRFALLSFGGAGGLHACALAESLEIPTVVIPPYAGVLSALGMVVAPPMAEASKPVLHLGDGLDDHRLYAEYGHLNMHASEVLPQEQLAAVEAYADLRFEGQSSELTVQAHGADRAQIEQAFRDAYAERYGRGPADPSGSAAGHPIEIVTLRLRRIGRAAEVQLPELVPDASPPQAGAYSRWQLFQAGEVAGPYLIVDEQATAFVPPQWVGRCDLRGSVHLRRVS